MSEPTIDRDPVRGRRRVVPGAVPGRPAAEHRRVRRPPPRAGRPDPRAAAGTGDGRAGPVDRPSTRHRPPAALAIPSQSSGGWATTGSSARSAGAGWGWSTRPSRSAWAAGWRSRSCPARSRATARPWSGSAARRRRRRGCTTPTSCRSSRSAATARSAYYAMQFIQGQGLDQVIDELARLRGSRAEAWSGGGPGPTAAADGDRPAGARARPDRRVAPDRPARDRRGGAVR